MELCFWISVGTLWLGFDDFDPIFKVTAGLTV